MSVNAMTLCAGQTLRLLLMSAVSSLLGLTGAFLAAAALAAAPLILGVLLIR